MKPCYLMSNHIHFHHRNRQGIRPLLKLMQYAKILPYICNSLRSIGLIIWAMYWNLSSRARKQNEIGNCVLTENRLLITIPVLPGPIDSSSKELGLRENSFSSKLVVSPRYTTLKSYSRSNKTHLVSLPWNLSNSMSHCKDWCSVIKVKHWS